MRLNLPRWGIVAVALAVAGGIAYASIPDANGLVHTCYTKSSGALLVGASTTLDLDTSIVSTCFVGLTLMKAFNSSPGPQRRQPRARRIVSR